MDFKILSGPKDRVSESSDVSSAGKLSGVDPRLPYLKKWSVTIPPSPQPSNSVPPFTETEDLIPSPPKSSTPLTETKELTQKLTISRCLEIGDEAIAASESTLTCLQLHLHLLHL
ncbi:Uncharacterized protein Rs2_02281 [Raphanus sativus]|nr:Uncharacterized protein Rs2_02281 [Raphanus sativus]